MRFRIAIIFLLPLVFVISGGSSTVSAGEYSYDRNNMVIGSIKTHQVVEKESLIEIARKFALGYNEIVDANPGIDPFLPGRDTTVIIPTSWMLPNSVPQEGIVINLSEMRLYYFYEQKGLKMVRTFPVGIGYEGFDTPAGVFKITEKKVKPTWYVPESVKKEKPYLPKVVPPGPDNPLGSHAMRLSNPNYLVHGTNRPWSIGRRASAGCIRLYPEDIVKLFELVKVGAKVTIIKQPVKVGIKDNRVYIEVHRDYERRKINYFTEATHLLRKEKLLHRINTEELYRALKEKRGIPVPLSP